MSIEIYIKEEAKKLCEKVYVAPEIPDKKMNGAIAGMTSGLEPEYVLAIADTTVFGGAKEGCLFTGECLYIHAIAREKRTINLGEISKVNYNCEEKTKDNGKKEKIETLTLDMKDGSNENLTSDLGSLNIKHLSEMLTEIVKMGEGEVEFVSTSQTTPLSMMDEEIKKNYIKLICNFAFSDDNLIDAKEYAEIISLLVRIEMNSNSRIEIRGYMTSHEKAESNDALIAKLSDELKVEDFEILKKSLIKDILFLNRKKSRDIIWKENVFITNLIDVLEIEEEQVDLIEEAIINDEDILEQRKNDSQIAKSMKDVASKAAAVGVPLAAIYLSGSVVGVSAAGITSGLATLGMGGMLGFSSMFTGIGVAVLVGVGTYKGLKKITGISDLENNKQRELMLQAIIKNTQKSLNYLIEDVNEISRQLTEEIRKGLETQLKISELTNILGMLSEGAKNTTDKLNYAEKEKVIAQLPVHLDMVRLKELTNAATKMKYREAVMLCYIEQEVEKEDGTQKLEYVLNDQLSVADLDNLHSIFEGLGYNKVTDAAIASIKGVTRNFMSNIRG